MLRHLLPILLLPLTAHAAITSAPFGKTPDNIPVTAFTLTNASGLSATILTHGATLQSLLIPDRNHKPADIVLGFDSLDGYLSRRNPFFGATAGRNANRIANATFPLDGTDIHLPKNDGPNNLHSGPRGFDKVEWSATQIDDHTLDLSYTSPDGENGFPGTLIAHVRYSLSDQNDLRIDYTATTDKPTLCNLTNHSYFNLAGHNSGTILQQTLMIDADQFTPNTPTHTPTGELAPVANTPFDFRTPHPLGDHLHDDNPQLHDANGYDHNFVLTKKEGLRLAATAYDPASGRQLDVLTTEPGLQLYTGNGLHNTTGKSNAAYPQFGAFCLETQHFPDAPNHPNFPSTVLTPSTTYHTTTVFHFTTRNDLDISTHWQPLHAGEAEGSIKEISDPTNPLLEIIETKAAAPLRGRTGALNPLHLPVTENQYYDITFTAHTTKATVGLVFSLETPDGKVLARTTLPEIGRKPQDTSCTPLPIDQWLHYAVALHARTSAPDASLTITPIEPTDITLNHLTLTVRPPEAK